MDTIIHNWIRCKKCGEIIESHTVHEFKWCSCGAVAVDGGKDYLRRCGNREDYEGLPWNTDPGIAERYMTVLFLKHEPEKIKGVFQSLDPQAQTVRTEALYLLALDRSGDEIYLQQLNSAVCNHSNNLEELYLISYYVDRPEALQEIIIPALKSHISLESLGGLNLPQKNELLTFLAHCQEIELMEQVLSSIDNIASLNTAVISEIYKALFNVTVREYTLQSNDFQKPDDFEAADRITERFLDEGTAKKLFLQIKVRIILLITRWAFPLIQWHPVSPPSYSVLK